MSATDVSPPRSRLLPRDVLGVGSIGLRTRRWRRMNSANRIPAISGRVQILYPTSITTKTHRPLAREPRSGSLARDPAAGSSVNPFLNHKGFHALQAHRVAHWYWGRQRKALAQCLQGRASEVFAVDIHPAAVVGGGVFIDHGTGVVIGETAVVGDNVSILQGVTLGGTGKETGDRHPKIGSGVLLSAGAKVLGNIRIGDGAKVGAGSVVLDAVPPHKTVVGVPARVVGTPRADQPALDMDQHIDLDDGG